MALRYMLDTNICIYIAKKSPKKVLEKFESLELGSVGMSIITHGELLYGVKNFQHPKKSEKLLQELSALIIPMPLTPTVAQYYGDTRAILEKNGTPIGNNDLWIAAHALAERVILVTNNTKEFARVPHLKIENWV